MTKTNRELQIAERAASALLALGKGFLVHPANEELRAAIRAGSIEAEEYAQLMRRLVCRLVVLIMAEARGLVEPLIAPLLEPEPGAGDDIWRGLVGRLEAMRAAGGSGVMNGVLLGPEPFEAWALADYHLLAALTALVGSTSGGNGGLEAYAATPVELVGAVYESLLDDAPVIDLAADEPFSLAQGFERKRSGAYYTPAGLVQSLIETALEPVLADRLAAARTREEREGAILGVTVCDPAVGAGHFLLAAARRLALELARVRGGVDEPGPTDIRAALHDVVPHCLFGVDRDPVAAELCKVALWLEGGLELDALEVLDRHIRCGDSLVGVFDLVTLEAGIPDRAYDRHDQEEQQAAAVARARNRAERRGQLPLLADEAGRSQSADRLRDACDLWTAAFFVDTRLIDRVPTTAHVRLALAGQLHDQRPLEEARRLAKDLRFFHWPLEFPEIFAAGGFDVVLGNPPWERLKLQHREFFERHDPELARVQRVSVRERMLAELAERNPELYAEYRAAVRRSRQMIHFCTSSGRYPLAGRGDINTYQVFTELAWHLIRPGGRAGIVVPTNIATDFTPSRLFRALVERRALVSLFDFDNRLGIFPNVNSRYKFCLLTLTRGVAYERPSFVFFLERVEELEDRGRRVMLTPDDFRLVNPATGNCPLFRSPAEADLVRRIYRRVPSLVRPDTPGSNTWDADFCHLMPIHDPDGTARTRVDLERAGFRLRGNVFERGAERYLPLYEGKMVHQFDHRWGSYGGVGRWQGDPLEGEHLVMRPRERDWPGLLTELAKRDIRTLILPRYWVPERKFEDRLARKGWGRHWFVGWRDTASATNEHTVISCLAPRVPIADSLPLILPRGPHGHLGWVLVANLNSVVVEFVARCKAGGVNIDRFLLEQLPILPPEAYFEECPWSPGETILAWIRPRVLELVYTAWDMECVAWELGYGGPPFKWDERRRAVIRAELDAAYALLYGLERHDLEHVLGNFRLLANHEMKKYGEYRTGRLVLERYDALVAAIERGGPYHCPLYLPPAVSL
jgi:hypothetical protein